MLTVCPRIKLGLKLSTMLNLAAAVGVEMTFEVVGGQLVESWTGKGHTFKRFHNKA